MFRTIICKLANKYIGEAYRKGFDDGNTRGFNVGYREGKEDLAKEMTKSFEIKKKKDTKFKKGYTPWNKGKKFNKKGKK